MWMDYDAFADLVVAALDGLPEWVRTWLNNVEVVVEDWPAAYQLAKLGLGHGETLLGLYEGIPQTARNSGYSMVLPDKITIFRGPILQHSWNPTAVREQVRHTVVHELAHHFGIDDDRLRELGAY